VWFTGTQVVPKFDRGLDLDHRASLAHKFATSTLLRLPGMIRKILTAVVLFSIVAASASADQFDVALAHAGRTPKDLKRDATEHPAELLRLAGITPGMRVADLLGGSGYYSELLSYVVGENGKVLLINNEAYDHWSTGLQARLAGNRLPNVEHATRDLNHMHLPDDSLDAVLLIKVYHDLYWMNDAEGRWPKIDVGSVLDQLSRALKPNGTILLVDHSAKAGTGIADVNLHRIAESYAIQDFQSHGFRVIGRSNLLKRADDGRDQLTNEGPMVGKTDRFVLVFRKNSPASSQ
jgi:predicted methyltransferase